MSEKEITELEVLEAQELINRYRDQQQRKVQEKTRSQPKWRPKKLDDYGRRVCPKGKIRFTYTPGGQGSILIGRMNIGRGVDLREQGYGLSEEYVDVHPNTVAAFADDFISQINEGTLRVDAGADLLAEAGIDFEQPKPAPKRKRKTTTKKRSRKTAVTKAGATND